MKQVLIFVESHSLQEYLCGKLEENGVAANTAINILDASTKMRKIVPDLIIVDPPENDLDFMKLLKQKKLDANTVNIPVILFARRLAQKQLLELVPYNVKKVFNKPLRVDALFTAISRILKIPFSIDTSPGIVEVHVNESIISIEIAQGINIDKLEILRYKISELINLYKIRIPKVVIILSDIKLTFTDAPLLQKLLYIVLDVHKVKTAHVAIITNDEFVRLYVNGEKKYANIKMPATLSEAMDRFRVIGSVRAEEAEEKAERLGDLILKAKTSENEEALFLKFDSEEKKAMLGLMADSLQNIRIAVVDDDFVIQELIKNTFEKTNAFVYTFSDGDEFLKVVDEHEFDLAFLDMNMPGIGGLGVLRAIRAKNVPYPIIAVTSVSDRDTMVRAIELGVKSYLLKPIKPEEIFMKSMEILKSNF